MTTEEAIEILFSLRTTAKKQQEKQSTIFDYVEALTLAIAALERDRWISVEDEGFPDKSGEYLFYGYQYFVPDHHGDPDNYKSIKSGYWMFNQSLPDYIGNMIFTHWRPLPEPPKEET